MLTRQAFQLELKRIETEKASNEVELEKFRTLGMAASAGALTNLEFSSKDFLSMFNTTRAIAAPVCRTSPRGGSEKDSQKRELPDQEEVEELPMKRRKVVELEEPADKEDPEEPAGTIEVTDSTDTEGKQVAEGKESDRESDFDLIEGIKVSRSQQRRTDAELAMRDARRRAAKGE